MICPNCNYTIYEETRFCPKCGTDLAQYNMFANIDKGANMATASMICGILSLFTGPLFAILSLIFASKYKKIGNGENAKNVKVGKVCSWISLGVIFAVVALVFAISGFIFLSEEEPLAIDTSALFIKGSRYNMAYNRL